MSQADKQANEERNDQALDDKGTDASEGRAMLQRLRDEGFDGSDEKLALALGRPSEEISAWIEGRESLDDDVVMKARGVAEERGVKIE